MTGTDFLGSAWRQKSSLAGAFLLGREQDREIEPAFTGLWIPKIQPWGRNMQTGSKRFLDRLTALGTETNHNSVG